MKISFNIDSETRSIHFTPESDIERIIITEMAEKVTKGTQLTLRQILHEEDGPSFLLGLKINGH